MRVIRIRIEDDLYELLRKRIKRGDLSAKIRLLIRKHIDEIVDTNQSYT